MLDPAEKLYELLLTEKTLADSQIGGYGDLSLKVLAFFGGTVAVLGWLYSDKGIGSTQPVAAAAICLAVVLLGCGVILQGIATYGFTLGYIQYKHETLNREFVRVAKIGPRYPFNHTRAWWRGVARQPVILATAGFVVLHLLLSVALIVFANLQFHTNRAPVANPISVVKPVSVAKPVSAQPVSVANQTSVANPTSIANQAQWFYLLVAIAAATVVYTVYVEYRLYKAIEHVFTARVPYPPNDEEDADISKAG